MSLLKLCPWRDQVVDEFVQPEGIENVTFGNVDILLLLCTNDVVLLSNGGMFMNVLENVQLSCVHTSRTRVLRKSSMTITIHYIRTTMSHLKW